MILSRSFDGQKAKFWRNDAKSCTRAKILIVVPFGPAPMHLLAGPQLKTTDSDRGLSRSYSTKGAIDKGIVQFHPSYLLRIMAFIGCQTSRRNVAEILKEHINN